MLHERNEASSRILIPDEAQALCNVFVSQKCVRLRRLNKKRGIWLWKEAAVLMQWSAIVAIRENGRGGINLGETNNGAILIGIKFQRGCFVGRRVYVINFIPARLQIAHVWM